MIPLNVKTYNYTRNLVCEKSAICSDKIVKKLELELGVKLKANKETDTINGYVSIDHTQLDHKIEVSFYSKDYLPNEKHKSNLKKLSIIPSYQSTSDSIT